VNSNYEANDDIAVHGSQVVGLPGGLYDSPWLHHVSVHDSYMLIA
jgi:hypothetical protein